MHFFIYDIDILLIYVYNSIVYVYHSIVYVYHSIVYVYHCTISQNLCGYWIILLPK